MTDCARPSTKLFCRAASGLRPTLGGHFAGLDAIMHLDPSSQIGGILGLKDQICQVQTAFFVHIVVAARAVIADKSLVGPGRLGEPGRPSR